ncbi:MAG: HAD-IC family P-type ATPase [Planctomycetaceae bacterium]
MSDSEVAAPRWHALPIDDVRDRLDVGDAGLTEAEAAARLREYGPNRLPHKPPPPWWRILLRQFANPLIYILAIAAIVSLVIQEYTDAGFIVAVILLNGLIGGYQEWRAEQSASALQKLLKIRAAVQRDGEVVDLDAEQVVPGDIVWLESGNRVPADIRLTTAQGLEVDESLLTGESLTVVKDAGWIGSENEPLGDRINMAFAGSIVARGRGRGIVVTTGGHTHVGELALDVVGSEAGKPPLLIRMERFTKAIAVAVLLASVAVGLIGFAVHQRPALEMFLFAVALAVSAIPEGLPVSMTVALSVATFRMSRRGVIIRKLTAVEGLGSCTLIATDKTGTLTVNALTVLRIVAADGTTYDVTGEGFEPLGQVLRDGRPIEPNGRSALRDLVRAAVLCNEADLHHRDGEWAWRGDAVDIAFLSMARKAGWVPEQVIEAHPTVNEIPFEPERQYAATFDEVDGQVVAHVKGAPERVLAMCAETDVAARLGIAEEMAGEGFRVLALAAGPVDQDVSPGSTPPEPAGLTLLGFVGMIDPLRPGVGEAVRVCHQAGVNVSMVTGDHRVTALAISRELGLATDESDVVTGVELEAMSPEELREAASRKRVFARVSPNQKLRIVAAAQEAGEFVAVTGDGVNDAPALRTANIGIAMGKAGTDVAREAAELVISDDDFSTIVAGIEEGRIAYDNIRKVIFLLVSTGAAEIVVVGLAVIAGMPLPLLPVQLLWLNLVTNGIQDKALAFEPGEGDTLRRPPRSPHERIFNRLMIERTLISAGVMGLVGIVTFMWLLPKNPTRAELDSARNSLLLLMVLFENVHVGNCRSETKSALVMSPFRRPIVLAGVLVAFFVHLAAMYVPLGQRVLGTAPVSWTHFAQLLALAVTVFVAIEIHKLFWAWRYGTSLTSVSSDDEGGSH